MVGHLLHKFAEFPLLDREWRDLTPSEKVAAFALRFLIALPTLSVVSPIEAVFQVPKVIVILCNGVFEWTTGDL